jgi:hypothetical protein
MANGDALILGNQANAATANTIVSGSGPLGGLACVGQSSSPGVVGWSISGPGVFARANPGVLGQSSPVWEAGVIGETLTGVGVLGRAGPSGLPGPPPSATGTGVFGSTYGGTGVRGLSATKEGVLGQSNTGTGVRGESENATAIIGLSRSTSGGAGVAGYADTGIAVGGLSKSNYGVTGRSTTGVGVYGASQEAAGVTGRSVSSPGVQGFSTSAPAVFGRCDNNNGVQGASQEAVGARGDSIRGPGLMGTSQNADGVYAATTRGRGVYARSDDGPGTVGVSLSKWGAAGASISDFGVYGRSRDEAGVRGESLSYAGVVGIADYAGVVGASSGGGIGVSGASASGTAVQARVGSGTALVAIGRPPSATAGHFHGDVVIDGALTVSGAKSAAVRHADGSVRRLYSLECPESWFEDFGEATIEGGSAGVRLDSDFAQLIDGDYHVFVSCYSSAYVTVRDRTREGFRLEVVAGIGDVTEDNIRDVTVSCSYRVVGRRRDVERRRLDAIELPTVPEEIVTPAAGSDIEFEGPHAAPYAAQPPPEPALAVPPAVQAVPEAGKVRLEDPTQYLKEFNQT